MANALPRRTILIATTNRGKHREIEAVMADLPVTWADLSDLPPMSDCIEDGNTFVANAEKKALHFARLSGLWTLADDSGLEVDALDGQPGIYSARFAGEPRSDANNNARLVSMLAGIAPEQRTARFRCALAIADPKGILARADGIVEGVIIDDARGSNGFGYDPHFLIPSLGRTAAELPPQEKNRISHRGKALQAIRGRLLRLLENAPASS